MQHCQCLKSNIFDSCPLQIKKKTRPNGIKDGLYGLDLILQKSVKGQGKKTKCILDRSIHLSIWPFMKVNHWRIKKIEQINQKVNQMPDADGDDNTHPPGPHHFKRQIFSLKNPSKNVMIYFTCNNVFYELHRPGYTPFALEW